MNLVKIGSLYNKGKYDGNLDKLKSDLKEITIYEPEYSNDLLENTVYFIGDNNSWFEVIENLVNTKIMDKDKYFEFKKLVDNYTKG